MGCNPIDRLVVTALLLTGTVVGASSQPDRLFEESPALNGSWRSRGIDGAMSVTKVGFAVGPHRFDLQREESANQLSKRTHGGS